MDEGLEDIPIGGFDTPGTSMGLPEDLDNSSLGHDEDGASQDVSGNTLVEPSVFPSEVDVFGVKPAASFNLSNLDAVISEAASSNGVRTGISFPWEQGIMATIFGETKSGIIPQVDMPVGYFEPLAARTAENVCEADIVTSSKTVFESCVEFGLFRTKLESQDVQFEIAMLRWESIIMHNPVASSLGRFIFGLEPEQQIMAVRTALGGKSASTLRKRAGQVKRFMQWGLKDDPDALLFPLTIFDTRRYFCHLTETSAARSVFSGWLECIGFLVHVVGVEAESGIHLDPFIRGTIRGLNSKRARRKQPRPFLVSELIRLEEFLMCSANSLVDRYICGCVLFAVFARARFGDLRDIEQFLEDIPDDHPEMGFVEMHSASHKMRSAADGLGLALPLVAPVRGFANGLWGVHFSRVARLTGLAFGERSRGPLIVAPDPLGSWTSRSLTNGEIGRWIRAVLSEHDTHGKLSSLTPHGAKATLLAYLARYGASPTDRLILGHHSVKQYGALETYSRDLQSGPLRVLHQMIGSVRAGVFHPDETRSGIFQSPQTSEVHPREDGLQAAESRDDSAYVVTPVGEQLEGGEHDVVDHDVVDPCEPSVVEDDFHLVRDDNAAPELPREPDAEQQRLDDERQIDSMLDDSDSGSSDSSSSSLEGSDDDIFGVIHGSPAEPKIWKENCLVYQHVKSKALHLLPKDDNNDVFLCGRKSSSAYRLFNNPIFQSSWRCKQCEAGKPIRSYETAIAALDRAVKRHKK